MNFQIGVPIELGYDSKTWNLFINLYLRVVVN
eukprot:CAMPEP_0170550794 /NCGR_PEP_ID=MMETSP0211-20121228/8820_1 /TAXON_ID=311385 /ORGANISM="Pseudokeronopsis sp., Strain OXSARD2" /LENGTH=31 /DNA_ID= /DNA_START= /DNA_END= /DNA_ORIENTATION=